MKSKIDHRSLSRFSIGVPVSAMRASARSCLTALVCLARRILDRLRLVEHRQSPRCCSSHGDAGQKAVARDDQVDVRQICRRRPVFNFSAGAAEGWATTALRLGANRAISAVQLASSEAGATSRQGLRFSRASSSRTSSSDKTWMVLPSPMSSARQAPSLSCASR